MHERAQAPNDMRYIIDANKPYPGHCQSTMPDHADVVGYTDGLTLEEYEHRDGFTAKVLNEEEIHELDRAYVDSMVTSRQRIEEERYDYSLNVLPPCKWHSVGAFNFFHVSERLSHNLVTWCVRQGEKYWTFTDRDNLTDSQLLAKMDGAPTQTAIAL